jgi:alcohol sulfotransferase
MRSKERQTGIPGHRYDLNDEESLRMRRGKPGGYADYLSETDIARVIQRCRSELTPMARQLLTDYELDEANGNQGQQPGSASLTPAS